MAIYMPPISRKKPVESKYNPNTFRIFGDKPSGHRLILPEDSVTHYTFTYDNFPPPPREKVKSADLKKNRPWHCGFLRNNCRFVKEPICYVETESTKDTQALWWHNGPLDQPGPIPPRTLDTTFRWDYTKPYDFTSPRQTRHGCNPNTKSALGIVPVSQMRERDGSQRFFKENISYEHAYDCRRDTNYPIRAKRHGSFVWNAIPAEAVERYYNHPGYNPLNPIYTAKPAHLPSLPVEGTVHTKRPRSSSSTSSRSSKKSSKQSPTEKKVMEKIAEAE